MCRTGQISRRTRDENTILNRDQRRKYESDLGAIQQEIDRITGVPKARQQAPPKEATRNITPGMIERMVEVNKVLTKRLNAMSGTSSPRFGMGQLMPERPLPEQPFRTPINSGLSPTQRPGLPGLTGSQVIPGSRIIGQESLGQTTERMSPSSFEALRQELRSIRARELYILNRLRQLNQVRNSQRLLNGRIPFGRNVPMLSQRRRISFGTPNVNQVPRTLRGSVTGQNVERRRMV